MAHGKSDAEIVAHTHNAARFFTENPHLAWVLLIATLLWGAYGYVSMPKRKDPLFPIFNAVAVCPWPGASATRLEQQVTRKIEERISENARVQRIESISRSNVSIVLLWLDERTVDTRKEFEDIAQRLSTLRDLPQGAGPIEFVKDFGDTATLMLTVTSPKVSGLDLELRAKSIRAAVERVRSQVPTALARSRATLLVCFPESIDPRTSARERDLIAGILQQRGVGSDYRPIDGSGFVGLDLMTDQDDHAILGVVQQVLQERLAPSEFHPDVWEPVVVRDPRDIAARLASVAGDKYSYRELDVFTDLIKRVAQSVPQVAKVFRAGLLPEQIYLDYSQERLASNKIPLSRLTEIVGARNITLAGGVLEIQGKSLLIDPSGEFKNENDIGNVIIGTSATGRPVYLRDGVEITRGYQTPSYLNFHVMRDSSGVWHRGRAITLAIQMRPGEQVADFGSGLDAALGGLQNRLPADLVLARPSDQPLQVAENVSLFMRSLYEAIGLVTLVALIGFWEWRSALLLAIAIPLTLAMTFGMMRALGLDLQQVSIASLILALGLLVDDPVVAGDAINRELDRGHPRNVAAWLGPTKLATAILFATITNIVAYLPILLMSGMTGAFIVTLPIVLTCSLIASRIVSMTFTPLLASYILRPSHKLPPSIEELRTRGFTGAYFRFGGWAVNHRWLSLTCAAVLVVLGLAASRSLKVQFFAKDLQYLSYVDVWLPEDATVTATSAAARETEEIVRRVAEEFGRQHHGDPNAVLESLTSFVGGGGPRFWFTVAPELFQPNYAQVVIKTKDKDDTRQLVAPLQRALAGAVAGARVDVRELETGKPVGIPVSVRVAGEDINELRRLAEGLKSIFRTIPIADRVRDDWGADSFKVKLQVDPDRANFAGVSNLDVALSSVTGINGFPLTTLRQGDEQIPVVARLRLDERARISDVQNLYVHSLVGPQRVPLRQVSAIEYQMETEKVRRRNQFRTITVSAFPVPGSFPSEVIGAARAQIDQFRRSLPLGYTLEIGGEEEVQIEEFQKLGVVMGVSVAAIFLALVFQFRHAFKPLIVFSAIPFGIVGALVSLAIMGAPFGFMAFLGVASLLGVIVSHVIVLFDFIEEMHEKGEPLREALLDAGIVRLRPVLITVGATVFGLVPLAAHGGPLWAPLCYAQIGGLTIATVVTLVLVPVLYAIFVLDLKIVDWKQAEHTVAVEPAAEA